jgi:hypothetical protein
MKPFTEAARAVNHASERQRDNQRHSDAIKRDILHTRQDMDHAFHELERRLQGHPFSRFVRLAYDAVRRKPWLSIAIALFVIGLFKRALRT